MQCTHTHAWAVRKQPAWRDSCSLDTTPLQGGGGGAVGRYFSVAIPSGLAKLNPLNFQVNGHVGTKVRVMVVAQQYMFTEINVRNSDRNITNPQRRFVADDVSMRARQVLQFQIHDF